MLLFKLNLAEKIHEIALDIRNSVKETFDRWKEAVELTGQKLETIKDHVLNIGKQLQMLKRLQHLLRHRTKCLMQILKCWKRKKKQFLIV